MILAATITSIALGSAISSAQTKLEGWPLKFDVRDSHESYDRFDVNISTLGSVTGEEEGAASEVSTYSVGAIAIDRIDYLKDEVRSYGELPTGWDSEESVPPNQQAIEAAVAFIDILPSGVPTPKAMLASNGTIGFYWRNEMLFADVELHPEGVSFFLRQRVGSKKEFYFDGRSISHDTGAEIRAAIESV